MSPLKPNPYLFLWVLLVALAILFLRSPGTSDVTDYSMRWAYNLKKHGVVEGYRLNFGDYPPLSSLILVGAAKAAKRFHSDWLFMFKVSLELALAASVFAFRHCVCNRVLILVFAATCWLNGVALGYLDTYFAPFMLLAIWALRQQRLASFSVYLSVATLIKWQPLIVAPFLLLHALSLIRNRKDVLLLIIPALVITGLTFAKFGMPMVSALNLALHHRYLSGQGLNIHWILTYVIRLVNPTAFGPLRNGAVDFIVVDRTALWVRLLSLMFAAPYIFLLWRAWLSRRSFLATLKYAAGGYLAYFAFNVGVHENHLFLGALLFCVIGALDVSHVGWAVAVAVVNAVNLVAFYGITGQGLGFSRVVGVDTTILFAIGAIVLVLCYLDYLRRNRIQASADEVNLHA